MPRPQCPRRVAAIPTSDYFKPRGVPVTQLEEIILTVDELEALRLADLEGLYHDQAATRMRISRPTFGRIVASARKKVAGALVKGKALRIEGGSVELAAMRSFSCSDCAHTWELPFGTGRPEECPSCGGTAFRRVDGDRGGLGAGAASGRRGGRQGGKSR